MYVMLYNDDSPKSDEANDCLESSRGRRWYGDYKGPDRPHLDI